MAHPGSLWKAEDFVGSGLGICGCGVAVRNKAALPAHRQETRCRVWNGARESETPIPHSGPRRSTGRPEAETSQQPSTAGPRETRAAGRRRQAAGEGSGRGALVENIDGAFDDIPLPSLPPRTTQEQSARGWKPLTTFGKHHQLPVTPTRVPLNPITPPSVYAPLELVANDRPLPIGVRSRTVRRPQPRRRPGAHQGGGVYPVLQLEPIDGAVEPVELPASSPESSLEDIHFTQETLDAIIELERRASEEHDRVEESSPLPRGDAVEDLTSPFLLVAGTEDAIEEPPALPQDEVDEVLPGTFEGVAGRHLLPSLSPPLAEKVQDEAGDLIATPVPTRTPMTRGTSGLSPTALSNGVEGDVSPAPSTPPRPLTQVFRAARTEAPTAVVPADVPFAPEASESPEAWPIRQLGPPRQKRPRVLTPSPSPAARWERRGGVPADSDEEFAGEDDGMMSPGDLDYSSPESTPSPGTLMTEETRFRRTGGPTPDPNLRDVWTDETLSVHQKFLMLADLPTINKPIFGRVADAFGTAAERVAEAFASDPSEHNLFLFLALPKVGLGLGMKRAGMGAEERLKAYPKVEWQWTGQSGNAGKKGRSGGKAKSVAKQVEDGKLGRAARMLADDAKVMDVDEELLRQLREKHPEGRPRGAFGTGLGPQPGTVPPIEGILDAMTTFRPDTAPGISGWTHHLLSVVLRRDPVIEMVHQLTGMIEGGIAPGQSMLCASRLTPLAKPDGGVRPIAVGELLYRLCTKVLLKHLNRRESLLPYQFGVGTRGGVEPLVQAIQNTLDKKSGYTTYTHITSLDFSNAFNALSRTELATGLRAHAPGLFRAAKWAYGSATDLVLSGADGKQHVLRSSEGVRQGDPFGPLFFSLGVRHLLESLNRKLGPDHLVLAYLDDVYIFAPDAGALDIAQRFFDKSASSLHLNIAKSKTMSVKDIRKEGMRTLGTCVGSVYARQKFLEEKIAREEATLAKARDLPKQHALLLIRQCLQQNLRHLQRTLKSDDLKKTWQRYDTLMEAAVLQMRGSPHNRPLDKEIITLPTKLGGLGVLSSVECGPHAYAAAAEASNAVLMNVVPSLALDDGEEPPSARTQRERCEPALKARRDKLLKQMQPLQRRMLAENSTVLGRRWLSVIPFNQSLSLSDFEISAALHLRTLCPGHKMMCADCGKENELGHDDVCEKRPRWRVSRHEQIKHVMADALKSSGKFGTVEVEPMVSGGMNRTDLRVFGNRETGIGPQEFDLTVVSMGTLEARKFKWIGEEKHEYKGELQAVLAVSADAKRKKYEGKTKTPFRPLVFSIGGAQEKETLKVFQEWQKVMSETAFGFMGRGISLILLRARTRHFAT
ncbi:hypothetical protein FFLO_07136 [Filobasidium floriforme]|uniref:Reverse transcriptase domain-containing protein n=1 Tax=Filobasidium floriforme TaxID=5210 RepID=A0A8K0JJ82_9TREE|nr:hypothetical protein FFLO_07136 [Filobasidium floriforme]